MATTRTPALCLVPTKALMSQSATALAEFYGGPIGCFVTASTLRAFGMTNPTFGVDEKGAPLTDKTLPDLVI